MLQNESICAKVGFPNPENEPSTACSKGLASYNYTTWIPDSLSRYETAFLDPNLASMHGNMYCALNNIAVMYSDDVEIVRNGCFHKCSPDRVHQDFALLCGSVAVKVSVREGTQASSF